MSARPDIAGAHREIMSRAFRRAQYTAPRPRGSAPGYPDDFAWLFGDENEATPDSSYEPDPVVNNGHVVFGGSVTFLPTLAGSERLGWIAPLDAPAEPLAAVAGEDDREVAEWLSTFYEPFTAVGLAGLTGRPVEDVAASLDRLRQEGDVVRQEVGQRQEALWVWRRAR